MTAQGLVSIIEGEMSAAFASRSAGEEGQARVHARRAAGWAAADYLSRVAGSPPPRGAVECLRRIQFHAELPADLREAARRLTVPVTLEHVLPHEEDLLSDARTVIDALEAAPD